MALAMVVAILGLTLSFSEDYATILHLLLAMVEILLADHAFASFWWSWLQGALLQSCELSQIILARHVHSHLHLGVALLQDGQRSDQLAILFLFPASSLTESNQSNRDQLSDMPSRGRGCAGPSLFGCGLQTWRVASRVYC